MTLTETANGQVSRAGAAIVAEEVKKVFGDRVVALEDSSFSVEPGQFVSVVGQSGCGKSTLLRLIAGLIDKTAGSIMVGGREVTEPRPDIGMMFQRPVLLPWKTALENVLLPITLRGKVTEKERKRGEDLLELTGLDGFEHTYPSHLSGGMQQRVALARLLMVGANLLLMDEPFGALDEFTRERLNIELMRIQADLQATVVFVTHNISEAVFLADRVLVMTPRPGRLAGVLDVSFPKPRKIELLKTTEFNAMVFEVREMLGANV